MNYQTDLEKIKAEIEHHDLLEMVSFKIAPPASVATIEAIETQYQITLDWDLKAFYLQMNGCQVYWQLKSLTEDEYDAKVNEQFGDYEPDWEDDDENPFAQIKINPLEECFLEDWFNDDANNNYEFTFGNQEYIEHQFSKRLKILDAFSTFSCMAYLADVQFEEAPLMMLFGHYADWWNSRLIDFRTYWQLLVNSRGIYAMKDRILGVMNGHQLPAIKSLDEFQEHLHPRIFQQ